MAELTDEIKALLDEPNLAHFVTMMPNGSPQVTPLWIDHDGTNILMNTALGRQKPRNIERDPRVAISVVDRNNNYRSVQVRGRVVETIVGDEAWASIDKLSQKYTGNPNYPRRDGEERVLYRIRPDHVTFRG